MNFDLFLLKVSFINLHEINQCSSHEINIDFSKIYIEIDINQVQCSTKYSHFQISSMIYWKITNKAFLSSNKSYRCQKIKLQGSIAQGPLQSYLVPNFNSSIIRIFFITFASLFLCFLSIAFKSKAANMLNCFY